MNEFYAYSADRAGLEAVMRFHAVKRWHMIDTTRQQTLAEHSANVALLAYYLAKTAPGMFFGPAAYVATLALIHDLPEVFTGDLPSHSKRHLTGVDDLEFKVLPKAFHDPDLFNERSKTLVKFCDLADGIRFIRLHGVDITASHAKQGLEAQLKDRTQVIIDADWPQEVVRFVSDGIHFYAYEFS